MQLYFITDLKYLPRQCFVLYKGISFLSNIINFGYTQAKYNTMLTPEQSLKHICLKKLWFYQYFVFYSCSLRSIHLYDRIAIVLNIYFTGNIMISLIAFIRVIVSLSVSIYNKFLWGSTCPFRHWEYRPNNFHFF
jgi:hypothetical protein